MASLRTCVIWVVIVVSIAAISGIERADAARPAPGGFDGANYLAYTGGMYEKARAALATWMARLPIRRIAIGKEKNKKVYHLEEFQSIDNVVSPIAVSGFEDLGSSTIEEDLSISTARFERSITNAVISRLTRVDSMCA
ncbi:hypothetical protein BHE74_00045655 [Ensete ventricosum]|nr:hypothetical protein GW17_00035936 [Ensete ventricosum]RWW48289.1 hypothetical protein BHE74_00045655 [Ensete ventricosum]RZS19145.1 hypothetical protein BHM03_00051491 [Ensete ventricosum]